MDTEDEILADLQDMERIIEEKDKLVDKQNKALEEKDQALEEKGKLVDKQSKVTFLVTIPSDTGYLLRFKRLWFEIGILVI